MQTVDTKLQRRRLELMKRRFDVDEEKKIVKLDLRYEHVDEVLDQNIDTNVPSFNREKFGRIKELISDFPKEYKVDVNFRIDDYGKTDPQEVMNGFNDAVELTHYSGNREHKKKWLQIIFLLITGILLLNIMARGMIDNWLQLSDTASTVFKEVFDIASWVFIWEAVSLLFLTPTEDRVISLVLIRRLNKVAFLDKKYKVLAEENYRDSYNFAAYEPKKRSVGKYALLISGAAFFGFGTSTFISFCFEIPNVITLFQSGMEPIFITVFAIMYAIELVSSIAYIFGGIAAISCFTGRGRFYKLVLPFGILTFLFEVAILVLSIILSVFAVSAVIGLIIATAYLVGVILLIITKEKTPKKNKKI